MSRTSDTCRGYILAVSSDRSGLENQEVRVRKIRILGKSESSENQKGYIADKDGVKTHPKKIEELKEYPTPGIKRN